MKATPEVILELSRSNSIAHYFVEQWKCGMMEWDEALIGMAVALAERCERYKQEAISRAQTATHIVLEVPHG